MCKVVTAHKLLLRSLKDNIWNPSNYVKWAIVNKPSVFTERAYPFVVGFLFLSCLTFAYNILI